MHDKLKLRASIGHIIRKEPHFASKQSFLAVSHIYEKEEASTLRQQASNLSFVSPQIKYTATATHKTSQRFSVSASSTFCYKAIITVVSHEHRHEFGATCIPPPTSRPSSSPRRGRNASASSHETDYCNPNPDQWEGKVSSLLQVFVVHLRIVQNARI